MAERCELWWSSCAVLYLTAGRMNQYIWFYHWLIQAIGDISVHEVPQTRNNITKKDWKFKYLPSNIHLKNNPPSIYLINVTWKFIVPYQFPYICEY